MMLYYMGRPGVSDSVHPRPHGAQPPARAVVISQTAGWTPELPPLERTTFPRDAEPTAIARINNCLANWRWL